MSNQYPFQKPWPVKILDGSNTMKDVIDAINELSTALVPQEDVFFENYNELLVDYAPPVGSNAITAGPIKVADGVTLIVTEGSVVTIM